MRSLWSLEPGCAFTWMISADKSWCLGILHAEMNKVFLEVLRPKRGSFPPTVCTTRTPHNVRTHAVTNSITPTVWPQLNTVANILQKCTGMHHAIPVSSYFQAPGSCSSIGSVGPCPHVLPSSSWVSSDCRSPWNAPVPFLQTDAPPTIQQIHAWWTSWKTRGFEGMSWVSTHPNPTLDGYGYGLWINDCGWLWMVKSAQSSHVWWFPQKKHIASLVLTHPQSLSLMCHGETWWLTHVIYINSFIGIYRCLAHVFPSILLGCSSLPAIVDGKTSQKVLAGPEVGIPRNTGPSVGLIFSAVALLQMFGLRHRLTLGQLVKFWSKQQKIIWWIMCAFMDFMEYTMHYGEKTVWTTCSSKLESKFPKWDRTGWTQGGPLLGLQPINIEKQWC